jgi:hypothetical protein
MKPRTFWGLILTLTLGAGTIWLLTEIRKEDGDPVICKWCWIGGHHHHMSEGGRPTSMIKEICSAQADFRANDRDGDGVNQFWRADIAGLYALRNPREGFPIKLIELSVAAADDRPVSDMTPYAVRSAKAGYWYRAIRHSGETTPDPNRFAAECHPADYPKSGRYTFIVDENNTIFRADLGHGRGIDVYPTDEELEKQWSKLD